MDGQTVQMKQIVIYLPGAKLKLRPLWTNHTSVYFLPWNKKLWKELLNLYYTYQTCRRLPFIIFCSCLASNIMTAIRNVIVVWLQLTYTPVFGKPLSGKSLLYGTSWVISLSISQWLWCIFHRFHAWFVGSIYCIIEPPKPEVSAIL